MIDRSWDVRKILVAIVGLTFLLHACSKERPEILKERYKYDSKGNIVERTLPDRTKIKYEYTKKGMLSAIKGKNKTLRFSYDPSGKHLSIKGKNYSNTYSYDDLGRIDSIEFKTGDFNRQTNYEYNPWGHVTRITVQDGERVEYDVQYDYDILGRPQTIRFKDKVVTYDYNDEKREIVRKLPNGVRSVFDYSEAGRLLSLRHENASGGGLIGHFRYEYNISGLLNRARVTTPRGASEVRYAYDKKGLLSEVKHSGGGSIKFTYDKIGRLLSLKTPERMVRHDYDSWGRLVRAGKVSYGYDRLGRPKAITWKGNKTKIKHDLLNMPVLLKAPGTTVTATYDPFKGLLRRSVNDKSFHYVPNIIGPLKVPLLEYTDTDRTSFVYGNTLLSLKTHDGAWRYFLEDGFNSPRLITDERGTILKSHMVRSLEEQDAWSDLTRLANRGVFGGIELRPTMHTEAIPSINSLEEKTLGLDFIKSPTVLASPMEYSLRGINDSLLGPMHGETFNMGFTEPLTMPTSPMELGLHDTSDLFGPMVSVAGKGLTERELRQRDPEYYAWIDSLNNVPPLTLNNYMRAWGLALGYTASRFGRSLLGGWTGATWEGIKTFSAPPEGLRQGIDSYLEVSGWHKSPVQSVLEKAFGALENHFRREYEEFTGTPLGIGENKILESGAFNTIEENLGGIRLEAEPLSTEDLRIGRLRSVVYDPEGERLVLVGDADLEVTSIRIGDLAEALALVYQRGFYGPVFSLDPADPRNPEGEMLRARYEPEFIRGAEIGRIMYGADWLLKQYSFGAKVEEEGERRVVERRSRVQGYRSIADISLEDPSVSEVEQWARMWIEEKDKKIRLQRSDRAVYIEEPEMVVKAKRQVPDPTARTGLRDVESDDPHALGFAELFTGLYDEFALESREFARLKEFAKALVVAKWLKGMGFRYDLEWLRENLYDNRQHVDTVPAISWGRQRTNERPVPGGLLIQQRRVHLFGGVNLRVEPEYVRGSRMSSGIESAVRRKLQEGLTGTFTITSGGERFAAVVVHLGRRTERRDGRIVEVNGVKYERGENGRVVKSTATDRSTAHYSYDATGRMQTVEVKDGDGGSLYGQRTSEGERWTLIEKSGDEITLIYSSSEKTGEVSVNGKSVGTARHTDDGVIISYPRGYTERLQYRDGKVVRKSIFRQSPKGMTNLGTLVLKYDNSGRPRALRLGEKKLLKIEYDDHGPSHIKTPYLERKFYRENGKLIEVSASEGWSVKWDYDDYILRRVSLQREGIAEPIISYDFDPQGRIISSYVQGVETAYKYDRKGRLRMMRLPDGRKVHYRYKGGSSLVSRVYAKPRRDKTGRKKRGAAIRR